MSTNEHPPTHDSAAPTGVHYKTVEEMLLGEGSSDDFKKQFDELSDATRVTRVLAKLRAAHGLTQKDMGERISLTQSAISKLEAGRDEDLKLGEVCAYARALNERIGVLYGPSLNHAEGVNIHLKAVKFHMLELAKMARSDTEMDNRMNKFFGDTFGSVMELLADVYTNLPNGIKGCEFSKEVIYAQTPTPASCGTSSGLVQQTRRTQLTHV